jgi:hypothetical protein
MTKTQDSKLRMYRTLRSTLQTDKDIVDAIPALAEAAKTLSDSIDKIEEYAKEQSTVSRGKTQVKHDEKATLVNSIVPVLAGLHALAHARNDLSLLVLTDTTKSKLLYTPDQGLVRTASIIVDQVKSNETELAPLGVTPETIGRLYAAGDNYYLSLHNRDESVATRKSTRPALAKLYAATDIHVENTLDKLLMVIMETQPKLYEKYIEARTPVPPGIRHRPPAETPAADPQAVPVAAAQQVQSPAPAQ